MLICWYVLLIFCLLFISGFAGFLPVFSCVLIDKWLIINTIHFSGLHAFSGWCWGCWGTLLVCGNALKNDLVTY
jgi:hypothetical protein